MVTIGNFGLILLTQLRRIVQGTAPKDRKYWSERDFLEKVSSYTRIHFEGKYKDVYSVPTASQRFAFDFFNLPYSFKGHSYNEDKGKPQDTPTKEAQTISSEVDGENGA